MKKKYVTPCIRVIGYVNEYLMAGSKNKAKSASEYDNDMYNDVENVNTEDDY